jgi:hypothetical protein
MGGTQYIEWIPPSIILARGHLADGMIPITIETGENTEKEVEREKGVETAIDHENGILQAKQNATIEETDLETDIERDSLSCGYQ